MDDVCEPNIAFQYLVGKEVGHWHSSIRSQFCNALLGAEEWQATSHLGRSIHEDILWCLPHSYIMKFLHDSGPEHMKPFAEDPEVISKFCGVALSRSVLAKPPQPAGLWWQFKLWGACIKPFLILLQFLEENPLVRNPIHLKFSNPEQYGSIVLYKLIPRIVNPTGNNCCHAACMSFHNVHSPNNVKFHCGKMSKLPNTNVQCCSDKLVATSAELCM